MKTLGPSQIIRIIRNLPVAVIFMATAGCALMSSCEPKALPKYSEFVDIDPHGWGPGEPAELTPWPRDSIGGDDSLLLSLSIRYTSSAPDTLRLGVTTESLDHPMRCDTIALTLRHFPMRPAGSGGLGLHTLNYPLSNNPAPIPDGLRIAIAPLGPVKGIASVGLLLNSP